MYADELGEYIRKSSVSAVVQRAKLDGRQVRSCSRARTSLDESLRVAAEPLMSPAVSWLDSNAHWWLSALRQAKLNTATVYIRRSEARNSRIASVPNTLDSPTRHSLSPASNAERSLTPLCAQGRTAQYQHMTDDDEPGLRPSSPGEVALSPGEMVPTSPSGPGESASPASPPPTPPAVNNGEPRHHRSEPPPSACCGTAPDEEAVATPRSKRCLLA